MAKRRAEEEVAAGPGQSVDPTDAVTAKSAAAQAAPSRIEQTLNESQVDPPGISPDQVETMGMPGDPSPPPGAPNAPLGDMPMRQISSRCPETIESPEEPAEYVATCPRCGLEHDEYGDGS